MDYGREQPYADDSAGYGGQQTGYGDQQTGYGQTVGGDGYGNDNMGYGDDTSHGYHKSSLRKEEVTSFLTFSEDFIASLLYPPIYPLKSAWQAYVKKVTVVDKLSESWESGR